MMLLHYRKHEIRVLKGLQRLTQMIPRGRLWRQKAIKERTRGLRRCAAPWMALLKPYRDVLVGVLRKSLSTSALIQLQLQAPAGGGALDGVDIFGGYDVQGRDVKLST